MTHEQWVEMCSLATLLRASIRTHRAQLFQLWQLEVWPNATIPWRTYLENVWHFMPCTGGGLAIAQLEGRYWLSIAAADGAFARELGLSKLRAFVESSVMLPGDCAVWSWTPYGSLAARVGATKVQEGTDGRELWVVRYCKPRVPPDSSPSTGSLGDSATRLH